MPRPNEQWAYLTLVDSFDPADITARLGVRPTNAWKHGSVNPRSQRVRTFSRWSLESRLPRSAELEAHIADVLAQMDENTAAFKAVAAEFGGNMQQ